MDTPEDRRISLRQPADERPFEAFCDDNEPHVVWLEDVSRTGMRFRSTSSLPCGAIVTLTAPETLRLMPVALRVLRVNLIDPLMPERGYEYGGEYLDPDDRRHAWYLATRARQC